MSPLSPEVARLAREVRVAENDARLAWIESPAKVCVEEGMPVREAVASAAVLAFAGTA